VQTSPGGARVRRTALTATLSAVVGLVITLAGCSTSTPASPAGSADASSVVQSLGKVPIPSAPATEPTPTASPGHPQLLAIGAPVHVTLPGATGVVTALGPDVTVPGGSATAKSATGTITITATVTTGTLTFHAADFTSRDETGQAIPLAASGPATVTAGAGNPGSVRVTGTFPAGAAQVTWRLNGAVLAIWDFNVELD
jgi:hypothetical protein